MAHRNKSATSHIKKSLKTPLETLICHVADFFGLPIALVLLILSSGSSQAAEKKFFYVSGNFTAKPCQAKSLLFLPGGPVATIGATTESHPLTNYFSGACLLTALGGQEKQLGTIWLNAQKKGKPNARLPHGDDASYGHPFGCGGDGPRLQDHGVPEPSRCRITCGS